MVKSFRSHLNNPEINIPGLEAGLETKKIKWSKETRNLKEKTQKRVEAVLEALEQNRLTYVSIESLDRMSERYKEKKMRTRMLKKSKQPQLDILGNDLDEDLGITSLSSAQRGSYDVDILGTWMSHLFRRHFYSSTQGIDIQGYIHYREGKKGIHPVAMIYVIGGKEYILIDTAITLYPLAAWEFIQLLKKEHEKLSEYVIQRSDDED